MSLSCEILKTLFNLTVTPSNESSEEEDYSIWIRLISILQDLLVTSTFVPLHQDNIVWYFKCYIFIFKLHFIFTTIYLKFEVRLFFISYF